MFREFTAQGSHKWFSILPKLINEYNNSKHRTIGMTPVQADADPMTVRVSTYKGLFTKGYLPSWSTEIFKIVKNETLPITYQLQDYMGRPIAGCFYSEELLKTNYPNDYLVEKIIRRKGDKIFVKWLGFDDTHNSWINTIDVKK
uniref:Chromo domain-containing protein n=2 Tax=Sipha flava TaxID=143950 RepID=A0A2S2R4V8_9HEMI